MGRYLAYLLASVSLMLVIQSAEGGTYVGDEIDENTVWTKENSPYTVAMPVTVNKGVSLRIEPGAVVLFDSGQGMTIYGTLIARGTEQDTIIMKAKEKGKGWNGLSFETSKACSLEYCYISGASSSAISNYDTTGFLYLNHCTISENSAEKGSGIYNLGGELSITNCIISKNSAKGYDGPGGGIYNNDNGEMRITNSTISKNSAETGGGISNNGKMIITNSTISENSAEKYGGGITNSGEMRITNSTISGNSAVGYGCSGGGIYNFDEMSITNCTISGNSASYDGGGIYNLVGELSVTNSTISKNYAPFHGGGISNIGELSITNSTISENSAEEGGGIYIDLRKVDIEGKAEIIGNTFLKNKAREGRHILDEGSALRMSLTIKNNKITD